MLSVRMKMLLAGGMIAAVLVAGVDWLVSREQTHLLARAEAARVGQTTQALIQSLKGIMLAGHGDIARDWLARVRRAPGILDARVYRRNGDPAFSDDETIRRVNAWLGEDRFPLRGRVPGASKAPPSLPVARAAHGETVRIRREGALTVLAPIRLEKPCLRCHGYAPNPVRGVLVLRLDPEEIVADVSSLASLREGVIAGLVLLTLLVALLAGEVLVARPLARLSNQARVLARRPDPGVRLAGENRADEFGDLARAFNRLLERVQGRWEHERALRELVLELGREENPEAVLRRIGAFAMRLVDAPYAMVSYRTPEGHVLYHPFGMDADALLARGVPWPQGKGVLGALWEGAQVLRLKDVHAHPQSAGFPEGHPPMKAFLGAPVKIGEETVGVIYFARPPGAPAFDGEDEEAVRAIASAASVVLERARHVAELRALNEELEARVQERTRELREKNRALKRREMELELLNQELEEALRVKDEFISTASHELRTPLNAVIGFAELLAHPRYGELSPKQRDFLERILQSGRRLVGIINDMLDISRIESGRMTVHEAPVSLPEMAGELEGELASLAAEKNLHYEVHAEEAHTVITDGAKLHQIMTNLIGNAIKFTPEGGKVEVRFRLEGAELAASVRDTGIGIPEKDLERIFRPFEQVEAGQTRAHKGTGLGLALSQKLAHLLGGEITVQSRPGRGSTFTLRIPVRIAEEEAPATAPAAPRTDTDSAPEEHPSVLLVDENDARAEAVARILAREGYEAERTTIQEAPARAHVLMPFVVLLGDPGDPGRLSRMLAAIKRDAALSELPVVLVRGDADDPRFLPGAIEFTGELLDANRLLDRLSSYGRLLAPVRGVPTVLLVDDDEGVRRMLTEALRAAGWRTLGAATAEEALRLAREAEPAVIVLDLMLPDLSGFALLEKLAADPITAEIPVIVHTGRALGAGDLARLGAAAEHVVTKGAGAFELVNHLRRMELVYPVRARLMDPALMVRNVRYLRLRLAQEARLTRRHGYAVALVGWEVNGLEEYAGQHGRRWATVALREMCDLVRGHLRASDEIARLSFTRFAVLLPHVQEEGARTVAEKLRLRIARARWSLPEGALGHFTASFGIVVLRKEWTPEEAFARLSAATDAAARAPDRVWVEGEEEGDEGAGG